MAWGSHPGEEHSDLAEQPQLLVGAVCLGGDWGGI